MAQIPIKRKRAAVNALQSRFLKELVTTECNFNISEACSKAGIGRRTFYNWMSNNEGFKSAFEDCHESRLDSIESTLHKIAVRYKDTTALIFLCKTLLKGRGYVEGGRVPVTDTGPVLAKVVDALMKGETSIDQAALELTKAGIPLPESIRIMLQRFTPPEKESADESTSTEELERRYQEALASVDDQVQRFLPERQKDIQELKTNQGVNSWDNHEKETQND